MKNKIIGFYNPTGFYPSQVIPIIIDSKQHLSAVFINNKKGHLYEISETVPFVKIPDGLLSNYDYTIDYLFAHSISNLETYTKDNEIESINHFLTDTLLPIVNPFGSFSLSIKSSNSNLIRTMFRNCIRTLITPSKKFASEWYKETRKRHKELLHLPDTLENYLHLLDVVTVGCSPDILNILEIECLKLNSIESYAPDEKLLQIWPSPIEDEIGLLSEYDLIVPESNEWLENNDIFNTIDKANILSSQVQLALNPRLKPFLPTSQITWSDFILYAIQAPKFTWLRPRSGTELGAHIDLLLFKAIAEIMESGELSYSEDDIIKTIESKVGKYLPNDRMLTEYAIVNGDWKVDAFVGQKHVIEELSNSLIPSRKPIIIDNPFEEIAINHSINLLSESASAIYAYNSLISVFNETRNALSKYGFCPEIRNSISSKLVNEAYSRIHHLQRPISVYLLIDVSGSMEGYKIEMAKIGMSTFLGLLDTYRGDTMGLIAFRNLPEVLVPMSRIENTASLIADSIARLVSGGGTALVDAIILAIRNFQYDENSINAIVVLTDGQENSSLHNYDQLTEVIRQKTNQNIMIFGLAYGEDADLRFLKGLSDITNGITMQGSPENIKMLYRKIAQIL